MNWDRPRFLISRLSHIGDAILTLPLACQLKRTFPNCQIAWAAEGAASKLLRLHPLIDRLIAVPKGWLKQPAAWRKLRRELRQFQPDVAFDPQGLLKSAALARLSSAPVRIGFSGRFGREGSTWLNNRLIEPRTTHLVDRTLELLRGIDLASGDVQFQLPACRDSLSRIQLSSGLEKKSGRWLNKPSQRAETLLVWLLLPRYPNWPLLPAFRRFLWEAIPARCILLPRWVVAALDFMVRLVPKTVELMGSSMWLSKNVIRPVRAASDVALPTRQCLKFRFGMYFPGSRSPF